MSGEHDPQDEGRGQEAQQSTASPWRFKGPKGDCLLHPEARILAIMPDLVYDNVADPPRFLGNGCLLTFQVPGGEGESVIDKTFVLESSEQVCDQILSRGGWR